MKRSLATSARSSTRARSASVSNRRTCAHAQKRTRAANRRLWKSLGAVAVLLVLALVASAIATQQVSRASNERDRARGASSRCSDAQSREPVACKCAARTAIWPRCSLSPRTGSRRVRIAVGALRNVHARARLHGVSAARRCRIPRRRVPPGKPPSRDPRRERRPSHLRHRQLDRELQRARRVAHGARRPAGREPGRTAPSSSSRAHPDPAGRTRERFRCPSCDRRRARSACSTRSHPTCGTRRFGCSPSRTPSPSVPTARCSPSRAKAITSKYARLIPVQLVSTVSIASGPEATVSGLDLLAFALDLYDTPAVAFATPDRLVVSTPAGRPARRRCPQRIDDQRDDRTHRDLASRARTSHAGWSVRDHVRRARHDALGPHDERARPGPSRCSRHCGGLALLEARDLVLCGEDFGRTVAFDLDTGELRTERYDLQHDRVEDLAVSDDGRVLAAIGSQHRIGRRVAARRLRSRSRTSSDRDRRRCSGTTRAASTFSSQTSAIPTHTVTEQPRFARAVRRPVL